MIFNKKKECDCGCGGACGKPDFNIAPNGQVNINSELKLNLKGSDIEMKVLNGERHLVGRAVLIVEGVLNGLLYPLEELEIHPDAWNGRPIPIDHPTNERGEFLSANDLAVFEKNIGQLMNSRIEGNALVADLWMNEAKLRKQNPKLLLKIVNKEFIEVSTGLFIEIEEQAGEFNGVKFYGIARNYKPDHLALLPNDIGACSGKDGCGLRSNKGNDEMLYPKNPLAKKVWNALAGIFSEDAEKEISYSINPDGTENTNNLEVAGELQGAKQKTLETNTMKEMVDNIISNEGNEWSETDREFLMSLNEEQLKKVAPANDNEKGEVPAEEGKTSSEVNTENVSTPEPIVKAEANSEVDVESAVRKVLNEEFGESGIKGFIQKAVESASNKRVEADAKETVINKIMANTGMNKEEDKAELQKLSLTALETLAKNSTQQVYLGFGSNTNADVDADAEVLEVPSDPFKKANKE